MFSSVGLLPAALTVVLFVATFAACDNEARETIVPEEPTPDPTRAAADSVRPDAAVDGLLVFLRGHTRPEFPPTGEVWVSDFDGRNEQRISPAGVQAAYVGTGSLKGGEVLYYLVADSETARSLWASDPKTGESTLLYSFSDAPGRFYADVSADGRYIAHTHESGLSLYDRASGATRLLFANGDRERCIANEIGQCQFFLNPEWSADGRLLLITEAVYEGGWPEVVDPFQDPPLVLNPGNRDFPTQGFWGPGSDGICAFGTYAGLTGLSTMQPPDWQPELAPPFADFPEGQESRGVFDCDWSGYDEVALVSIPGTSEGEAIIHTYDRASGTAREVGSLPGNAGCCGAFLEAAPGVPFAVAQLPRYESGLVIYSQPARVNFADGSITPVLQDGDLVLDIVPR